MEITSKEIKKGVLLTFKDVLYHADGSSELIPEPEGKIVAGILVNDTFLDIDTGHIYDFLYFDEEGFCTLIPALSKPYIYGIEKYSFRSKEEEEYVLQKAQEALETYEEKGNMISFEKQKRRENRSQRR